MGWMQVNPVYRETFRRHGLASAADFLRLPGLILSGHPDRHVMRVELPILAGAPFLKKEHRVRWQDRFANFWAGFGFVSKSTREAKILQRLAQAGVPCPEVMAVGEHASQAFVFLSEEPGMAELRHFLQKNTDKRLSIADALGRAVAHMHAQGFWHGDLYTKHVLVKSGPQFCFLDWQRGRHRKKFAWAWRCHDLATLDATLPESLADDSVRRVCLRSYMKTLGRGPVTAFAGAVRRLSLKLQKKPRIQALKRLPLPPGTQTLVWLDGEALCVTGAFHKELSGQIPSWLRFRAIKPNSAECRKVRLETSRAATLTRRSVQSFSGWLRSWWRRAPAPEVQQAALLFHLERCKVACPKLLAFGQLRQRFWSRDSFILTESQPVIGDLASVLAEDLSPVSRGRLLKKAGELLRRIHEAGYVLAKHAADFAAMCAVTKEPNAALALTRIDGLERKKRSWSQLAMEDLPRLRNIHRLRETEAMCFFLGYLGAPRLTSDGRALARKMQRTREVAQ
jgi:tRNA A-37 threonylcarbamoyl transferase component Bud32